MLVTCISVWVEMGHLMYLKLWCPTSPSMVHFEKILKKIKSGC